MLQIPDTNALLAQLRELRADLSDRTQALAAKVLSPRQLQIWRMHTQDGLTQAEIARQLGLIRHTVHFSLFGRKRRYRNGRVLRVGGSIATLRQHASHNTELNDLLERIQRTRAAIAVQEWRPDHARDWLQGEGHDSRRRQAPA